MCIQVYGYVKNRLRTGERIEVGESSLPPMEFQTRAFWIDLPLQCKRAIEALYGDVTAGALHVCNSVSVS
jgi:ATP-dependent helicase YprA (DUF1998 family)